MKISQGNIKRENAEKQYTFLFMKTMDIFISKNEIRIMSSGRLKQNLQCTCEELNTRLSQYIM